MINLGNLNRQHDIISAEVKLIEEEINKEFTSLNTIEIALHISKLAGYLKMHLLEEDKSLYPELLKSGDGEVQTLAKQYSEEMGSLNEAYTNYKTKYNVSSKINQNLELFLEETKKVLQALKQRIEKENNVLYKLIDERKL